MSSDINRKKPRAPARVRCGVCEDCLRPDCGKCRFCLGKTKFGGDGKVTKEACIHRRCKNLQVRAPKPQGEPKPEKKKRKRNPLPPLPSTKKPSPARLLVDRESMHCYGCPVPKPTNDVCAGCLGTRDEHLNSEPILLCDGSGCNSEYHLQCCIPEMTEVPNGNYYCLDCSRGGSADQLDHYLDKTQEERHEFDSSLDYINECLLVLCEKDEEIPRSEVDRLSLLHADAMSTPSHLVPVEERPADAKEPQQLGPDFLIGKPMRLYCPDGNQYHSGRILDYRKSAFGKAFWGSSVFSDHEFLVLFPAGSEARKRSIKTWLLLEEHSCAVGVSLVWGQAAPKKGILGWRPAMTYLRSSIELAAVQSQLSVADKQIYMRYGSLPLPKHPSWALSHFLGSSGTQYALLNLKEEAIDLFSKEMATLRKGEGEASEKTRAYISYALSEKLEEERVRKWRAQVARTDLPKTHPKVLSAIDEDALGPIKFAEPGETRGINLPCPAIPMQGISRQWLLKQLGDEKKYGLGLTLTCRSVGSSTDIISKYREQQIQVEFERSKESCNTMEEGAASSKAKPSENDSGKSTARMVTQREEEANKNPDGEVGRTDTVIAKATTESLNHGREASSTEMELDGDVMGGEKVVDKQEGRAGGEEVMDGMGTATIDQPEPGNDIGHTTGIHPGNDESAKQHSKSDDRGKVMGTYEIASPASTVTESTGPKVGSSGDVNTPDCGGPFGSPMSDHGWSENETKQSPASSTSNM